MPYRIVQFLVCIAICSSCVDRTEPRTQKVTIALSDSLRFWSDVAPVVFNHCTPCHHEGGAGPFPLTTYSDFNQRIKTIRLAIADRFMPPWPADPTYRHFKDEKVLNELERATIIAWIDQGAHEGEAPDSLPIPKTFVSLNLGEPDKIIHFPHPIEITGNARDYFALVRVNFELERDTLVRAIAFVPGNKSLVHHVNGHLLNYIADKKTDFNTGAWLLNAEEFASLDAYRELKLAYPDGTYPPLLVSAFNYLPGVEPTTYPNGLGTIHVSQKSTFLLNTLHYGPSPIDTSDQSEIHIYFANQQADRPLQEIQMGTQGETAVIPEFFIPADSVCTFSTTYLLNETISVLTINPHMHLLGKTFKAFAVSPDNRDTIPLISIPDWDFRWQFFYNFPEMLVIPKGYRITAVAKFDNTRNNPLNPNNPPIDLKIGGKHMKTTDEMFQFFITFVSYRSGDENIKL